MKKKLIGLIICTLLITTVLPIVSSTERNQISDNLCGCDPFPKTNYDTDIYPEYPTMKEPYDIIINDIPATIPAPVDTPDEYSWTDYNGKDWTTPAKNQAYCGSCWAFAAVGALEPILEIRENCSELNPDLSEQYILSCLPNSGSCWGGNTAEAFRLILATTPEGNSINGIIPESCFPYRAIDAAGRDYGGFNHDPVKCTEKCNNWQDYLIPISNFGVLDLSGSFEQKIEKIKSQIIQYGPVAAGIMATNDFKKYWRESTDPNDYYPYISTGGINHIVVIVGWKDDPSIGNGGYWIVKNSWGQFWGYNGFFNIEYGSLNIDRTIIWVDYDPEDFDWEPIVDTGGPYGGFPNIELDFDGSKSFAVEGDIVQYNWDFDDGEYDTSPITTHTYTEVGVYDLTLTVIDSEGNQATGETKVWIQETNEPPNTPSIDGPLIGRPFSTYELTFTSTDPEGNDVFYYIEWGDESIEEWIGSYESGDDVKEKNSWDESGNFIVRAKSKDVYGEESDWGTFQITMPRTRTPINNFLYRFLERFPNAFPLLRHVLGL